MTASAIDTGIDGLEKTLKKRTLRHTFMRAAARTSIALAGAGLLGVFLAPAQYAVSPWLAVGCIAAAVCLSSFTAVTRSLRGSAQSDVDLATSARDAFARQEAEKADKKAREDWIKSGCPVTEARETAPAPVIIKKPFPTPQKENVK